MKLPFLVQELSANSYKQSLASSQNCSPLLRQDHTTHKHLAFYYYHIAIVYVNVNLLELFCPTLQKIRDLRDERQLLCTFVFCGNFLPYSYNRFHSTKLRYLRWDLQKCELSHIDIRGFA